jgi:hypothetical protein
MRRAAVAFLSMITAGSCRPYDNYSPVVDQDGLIPPAQFARYGREQAELVAIGRSFGAWTMTQDEEGLMAQAHQAECFARRFPDVETVDADPLGHRLTIRFRSGWRAAVLPIPDGTEPESTPGISRPGPSPCKL